MSLDDELKAARPPEPQPWTNRRRAVFAAGLVIALASLGLAGGLSWGVATGEPGNWPVTVAFGLALGSGVLLLDGYMRQARGERADYLKNLSAHVEAVGRAIKAARSE